MKTAVISGLALLAGMSAVSAEPVYPGCAQPRAKAGRNLWYVDPVNGNDANTGTSPAAAWQNLQLDLMGATDVSPKLATVPYWHRPAPGQPYSYSVNPLAPVQPGDVIYLAGGSYGDIKIGLSGQQIVNSDFIWFYPTPGTSGQPTFSTLTLSGVNKLWFDGLKIQSTAAMRDDNTPLISLQGDGEPVSDIDLSWNVIQSVPSATVWQTTDDWRNNARNGLFLGDHNLAGVSCVSMHNNLIRNVRQPVSISASNIWFDSNKIDTTGDGGIDWAGDNITISHNLEQNMNSIGDNRHLDFMEGILVYPAGYDYTWSYTNQTQNHNNTIYANTFILESAPGAVAFPGLSQGILGIGSTEAFYNLLVSDNVVVGAGLNGIDFSSIYGGAIVNNTVVTANPPGYVDGGPNATMRTLVYTQTAHPEWQSHDVLIRNNVSAGFIVDVTIPNLVMDHNICTLTTPATGKCFVQFENAANQLVGGGSTAGVTYSYGNNISAVVDTGGWPQEFANYNPSAHVFDLHPATGGLLAGGGSAVGAPTVDVAGRPVNVPPDIGAYAYFVGD